MRPPAGQAPARPRQPCTSAAAAAEAFARPCKGADTAVEGFRHPCKTGDTVPEGFDRRCKTGDPVPEGFRRRCKTGDTAAEAFDRPRKAGHGVAPGGAGRAGAAHAGRWSIFARTAPLTPARPVLNPTPFFAADFFGTRDVTLPRLQKFSVDVIERLAADNPGQVFNDLVADLTAHHTALFGAMTGVDQGISQRRTAAQQMWGALADVQHQLAEDEALIEYKAVKTPALHQAFFPNGRSEYTNATLLTAELLLARVANATATHAKTLGADFDPALYAGFLKNFLAGRADTGAGDQRSAQSRAEAEHHRQDLTLRLTDAVKLVAAHWLRDEPRAAAYFRVGLLSAPAPAAKAG